MYQKLLESRIRTGILNLTMPDGTRHRFGSEGQEAYWHMRDKSALSRIIRNPAFEMGQTFMEGGWDTPDLRALLSVLRSNFRVRQNRHWYTPLLKLFAGVNRIANSYRNVSFHYDVREEVFRLLLDREMFYSCAYFRDPGNSLEQAQLDKADHIAGKLQLEPGMKVLDIGCGWGSLAFRLASRFDVEITGITLSQEQLRVARLEAEKRGLHKVKFELCDYREHQATYDRVVSVGMLEHVGRKFLPEFFARVSRLLNDDGIALIHSIGITDVPGYPNPWMDKYVFPGGFIPSLSLMAEAAEQSGLMTTDVESLRQHYAYTLQHWHERFLGHRDMICELMNTDGNGETFCRMWEFYLTACESAFLHDTLVVYQYQLAKRHGLVPVTRDYQYPD